MSAERLRAAWAASRTSPIHIKSLAEACRNFVAAGWKGLKRSSDNNRFLSMDADVGSVGDSYDNASAETVNGLFKTEVFYARGPWRS
jgi:transposase InsO family protein